MNDITNNFWMTLFIAEAINLAIIWIIVNYATKSERRQYSAQTELLARMAIKQGVPMQEVEEILKKAGISPG